MKEISVTWDNESETIIRYDFPKSWTWNAFFEAKARADAMIDDAKHRNAVGAILYLPKDVMLPPNIISIAGSSFSARHPRAAIIVFVTESLFLKLLWETLKSLYPDIRTYGYFTDLISTARQVIEDRLASQPQVARSE